MRDGSIKASKRCKEMVSPEYKVFEVEGGHQIFWCPSAPLHYNDRVPHSPRVYPHPNSAYRRCKQLNERYQEAIKKTDEMIKKDGAIII